jgi:hypothetical protein
MVMWEGPFTPVPTDPTTLGEGGRHSDLMEEGPNGPDENGTSM